MISRTSLIYGVGAVVAVGGLLYSGYWYGSNQTATSTVSKPDVTPSNN